MTQRGLRTRAPAPRHLAHSAPHSLLRQQLDCAGPHTRDTPLPRGLCTRCPPCLRAPSLTESLKVTFAVSAPPAVTLNAPTCASRHSVPLPLTPYFLCCTPCVGVRARAVRMRRYMPLFHEDAGGKGFPRMRPALGPAPSACTHGRLRNTRHVQTLGAWQRSRLMLHRCSHLPAGQNSLAT